MSSNSMSVEHRNLSDLKPYSNYPRTHSRRQREKLKTLLMRFGQLTPVIVDAENVIVDGAAVVETWKALGNDQIAVIVTPSRDPAAIRAIRLALNRLPADAGWDGARLKVEFEELLELGFDMSLTGFDTVEIDMALAIDEPSSAEVEDPPAGPRDGPATAQPGDVWLMDQHRVACGDARDRHLLARLMNGASAQVVFTDPPYNVAISGFVVGKGRHREFAFASGEMAKPEFTGFLAEALDGVAGAMMEGGVAFVCMDWRHIEELLSAVAAVGLTVVNLCVWAKTNPGMGSLYRSQHELVFVLKKGDAPHVNNV